MAHGRHLLSNDPPSPFPGPLPKAELDQPIAFHRRKKPRSVLQGELLNMVGSSFLFFLDHPKGGGCFHQKEGYPQKEAAKCISDPL